MNGKCIYLVFPILKNVQLTFRIFYNMDIYGNVLLPNSTII